MCLEIVVIFLALYKDFLNMDTSAGIMSMIFELKKKCSQADQQLMRDLKVSQSELLFFSALDNCQGISSPELAKNMGLSLSRISRVVDKLVVNGYLERNTDATDRRAIKLCLTTKGKAIRNKIDKARNECEERLLEIIPATDIQQFEKLFSEIVMKM
jgi:DNA-binding MarR family transcriptional regulator